MKSNRQRKLREYNEMMPGMEEILFQAEYAVALLCHRALPTRPEPVSYHTEGAVIQRLQYINDRLDELALEKEQALQECYHVPEDAGALARCLTTWIDPSAPSQERLTNHG